MHPIAYTYPSRIGVFMIGHDADGSWTTTFEGRVLGEQYPSPEEALNDLSEAHCSWSESIDLKSLALPHALGDWNPVEPSTAARGSAGGTT